MQLILALILRRLALSGLILLLAVVVVFVGTEILLGDVLDSAIPEDERVYFSEEDFARMRIELGLDRPMLVRFGETLYNLITFDFEMSVPELLLIAILVLTFGKEVWALFLIVAIVYTPGAVRVIRSRTVSIAAFDFIRAAELRGENTGFILIREIVPNLRGLVAVEFAMRCSSAVLKISALSFLGLGISQPTPDWGLMVQEAMTVVFTDPWFVILPAIALSSLIIGINFAVDGLARAYGVVGAESAS